MLRSPPTAICGVGGEAKAFSAAGGKRELTCGPKPRPAGVGNVLATFTSCRYRSAMPEDPNLRPATTDEIMSAHSFALRFQGRKRVRHADDIMAKITADRLVKHLEASGFVVMKRPPATPPTTSHMPSSQD
jgi:hypothetical protein